MQTIKVKLGQNGTAADLPLNDRAPNVSPVSKLALSS
jgi:hypothetical protein